MLDPAELPSVEARLQAVEARTGVQVVVAAVERADVYHGLRWRAFAFGAAVSGALVALSGLLRPASTPAFPSFWAVATVLGAGLLCALATTLSPALARLFLEPLRAQAEVRQRAALVFLERELFATRERTGVLLLASGFERLAVVISDSGFRGRVSEEEWRALGEAMTSRLRAGGEADALLAGLDALERLLVSKGFLAAPGRPNELPDQPYAGEGSP